MHQRLTVLKSIHVHKKHRVQYETRTYFRYLDFLRLTGSTADTFLEYIQRNLPEGVAMKTTKVWKSVALSLGDELYYQHLGNVCSVIYFVCHRWKFRGYRNRLPSLAHEPDIGVSKFLHRLKILDIGCVLACLINCTYDHEAKRISDKLQMFLS